MTYLKQNKVLYFKNGTIIASLLLFFISLTQTAFYIGKQDYTKEVESIYAFLCGVFVAIGTGFSWLANPFLITSWILLFKKPKQAQSFSLYAVILSLSFLFLNKIVTSTSGSPNTIAAYGTGYWLWLSSCVINYLGISITRKIEKPIS